MYNKKRIVICIAISAVILAVAIFITVRVLITNNENIDDAVHAITLNEDVIFYKKAKTENVKIYGTVELGTKVYIVDELQDEEDWCKVNIDGKEGYILTKDIGSYKKSDEDYNLMIDVSQFNYEYNFDNSNEFGAFLINNNIDYVYIRIGGRGYGEEGNFYYDEYFKLWADECEYLGIPFGFYFLDEALDNNELDEEVDFITEFLDENSYSNNTLPLAIDVESHEGNGRADNIWNTRAHLVSRLLKNLRKENIQTIVYSNASTASEYLSTLDTDFWISYYPALNGKVPDYWYDETDQESTENKELMKKIVAWQFTDTGVSGVINKSVDLSLVLKNAFEN